ncbi:MAG: TerC family protein [Chloroflexota bacterium]|nr:TerC family protein [Chloroflexota bacterium]
MEMLSEPAFWTALLTLTALEIILGIDNIIFISILSDRLPAARRGTARTTGLLLAMLMRIGLLFSIGWMLGLTTPLFAVASHPFTGRDLILAAGGLFLIYKSTTEIHAKLEGEEHERAAGQSTVSFASVIVQILLLDIVFSLDSVITAIGMTNNIMIAVIAVVISVGIMLFAARPLSDFVNQHPTIKILALSFLLLLGMTLVAEGFGQHIPKGYIYFAMAFSVFIELLNMRLRKKSEPVHLHQQFYNEDVVESASRAG